MKPIIPSIPSCEAGPDGWWWITDKDCGFRWRTSTGSVCLDLVPRGAGWWSLRVNHQWTDESFRGIDRAKAGAIESARRAVGRWMIDLYSEDSVA